MPTDLRPSTGPFSPIALPRRAYQRLAQSLSRSRRPSRWATAGAAEASWNLSIAKTTVPAGGTGFDFSVTGPSSYSKSVTDVDHGETASGAPSTASPRAPPTGSSPRPNPARVHPHERRPHSGTSNAIDLETVYLGARSVRCESTAPAPRTSPARSRTRSRTGRSPPTRAARARRRTPTRATPTRSAARRSSTRARQRRQHRDLVPALHRQRQRRQVHRPGLPNGRYFVREAAAPAGWRTYQSSPGAEAPPARARRARTSGTSTPPGGRDRAAVERFAVDLGQRQRELHQRQEQPGLPAAVRPRPRARARPLGLDQQRAGRGRSYKAAAQSFINELAGTPTRVKIDSFAATASRPEQVP